MELKEWMARRMKRSTSVLDEASDPGCNYFDTLSA
jgi:aryl-alcohol dehydrogenase-like predicted oxidoreductase